MKNAFSILRSKGAKIGTAVAALAATAGAHADSLLPTDFATSMGDVKTDMLTVGAAIIVLCVAAVGIKWTKATFF